MKLILVLFSLCIVLFANAQTPNVINTAVPFLRVAPDARGSAIGDGGVATSPDVHSIFWNTSKLAFINDEFGASATYTPWLRELVNNIFLLDISTYWKFDSLNVITASFRDFNLGEITFTDTAGNLIANLHPNEFTVHIGYARKLSNHFSAGINFGYVYSDLATGYTVNNVEIQPASTVMTDLSLFYTHPVNSSWFKGYNIGAVVSNLGGKISYTGSSSNKDFLPANLGIGSNFDFQFGSDSRLSLLLDLNKLLVPTPDTSGIYKYESVLEGVFKSFSDAPGGFDEEISEINLSTGAEYWFRSLFALRSGYFYESKNKGSRQFVTVGAGAKYHFLQLDFSYLIPTSSQKNPLDNTFRLGLTCNINSFHKYSGKS